MVEADVPQVAAMHLSTFADYFVDRLGPRFIQLFCKEMTREIAFVAAANRSIVGFAIGTAPPGGIGRLVKRRAVQAALVVAPLALRRPAALARIARALLRDKRAGRSPNTATLMFLASSPDVRRQGLARRLSHAWLREAAARGASKADGQVDERAKPAIALYLSTGAQIVDRVIRPGGEVKFQLEWDLKKVLDDLPTA